MAMKDFNAPACPKCGSTYVKDVQIEPQALSKVQGRAATELAAFFLTGGLYGVARRLADPFGTIDRRRAKMLVEHTLWQCNLCDHRWVGSGKP
jgi:ribosomal protein L37AE/L43A